MSVQTADNMLRFVGVLLLIYYLSSVNSFLHQYPRVDGNLRDGDPGDPLYFTPYIESGNISEARRLARVPFTEGLRIKSYSGFFTVSKELASFHFLWYFPAMIPNGADAPVILWLQGGPGASSLYGLFTENGPIRVRNGKFERRKYNWALNHHIIYIDNPVGTGFSFSKDILGFCSNEKQVGEQLYSTLIQFFKVFPELQENKFFISGESYAGKYVPAVAYTIHKKNPKAEIKINLKGITIGNGLSDPVNQLVYSKYLYQIGLLDANGRDEFAKYEEQGKEYIRTKQYKKAFEIFDLLLNGDLIKPQKSLFYNLTGFDFYFNFLHTKNYIGEDFGPMLQKSNVRQAIHVGDLPFNDGTLVEKFLEEDVMQSVAPWISELLDHYFVLIYNGQLDVIVAYPLTINYLQKLNFTAADKYKVAKRHIWRVDGEVAGYEKHADNLIEVLVRNAGHMVPADQPKWALDLITRFTHEKAFSTSYKHTLDTFL